MRKELLRRLEWYWRLELFNVLVLPAFTLFLSVRLDQALGLASLIAYASTAALLIVGGLYWHSKARELSHRRDPTPTLRIIAAAQTPLLLLTLIGAGAAVAAIVWPAMRASTLDAFVAAGAALLAVLEYVNYYHVQLQHFDRWSDFQRLISGRGFRRSKLREDLDRLPR